jgi:hypothetical protein
VLAQAAQRWWFLNRCSVSLVSESSTAPTLRAMIRRRQSAGGARIRFASNVTSTSTRSCTTARGARTRTLAGETHSVPIRNLYYF